MSSSSEESTPAEPECPVSEEWMSELLASHHGLPVRVTSLDVGQGCEQGESVLSDILAVQVGYDTLDGPARLSLVVKLLPQDPFSRYFVTEAQFDLREIKFYTEVKATPISTYSSTINR